MDVSGFTRIEPAKERHRLTELVIESESPILTHGPVADPTARAKDLVAPLRAAGVAFTAECQGPQVNRDLLLELPSPE